MNPSKQRNRTHTLNSNLLRKERRNIHSEFIDLRMSNPLFHRMEYPTEVDMGVWFSPNRENIGSEPMKNNNQQNQSNDFSPGFSFFFLFFNNIDIFSRTSKKFPSTNNELGRVTKRVVRVSSLFLSFLTKKILFGEYFFSAWEQKEFIFDLFASSSFFFIPNFVFLSISNFEAPHQRYSLWIPWLPLFLFSPTVSFRLRHQYVFYTFFCLLRWFFTREVSWDRRTSSSKKWWWHSIWNECSTTKEKKILGWEWWRRQWKIWKRLTDTASSKFSWGKKMVCFSPFFSFFINLIVFHFCISYLFFFLVLFFYFWVSIFCWINIVWSIWRATWNGRPIFYFLIIILYQNKRTLMAK